MLPSYHPVCSASSLCVPWFALFFILLPCWTLFALGFLFARSSSLVQRRKQDVTETGNGWIPQSWVLRSGQFHSLPGLYPSRATCTIGQYKTCGSQHICIAEWPLGTGRRMPLWASLVDVPSGLVLMGWASAHSVGNLGHPAGIDGSSQTLTLHPCAKPSKYLPLSGARAPCLVVASKCRHFGSPRLQRALASPTFIATGPSFAMLWSRHPSLFLSLFQF